VGAVQWYCPRAKDEKRQKKLGLDVQAFFQSLRVQQVAPTVSPVGSGGASAPFRRGAL